MNIIEKDTTKEQVEQDYSDYREISIQSWHWNRFGPIFYETPYGSTVLDIGANTGEFVELLEKQRGCKATGVDISKTAVDIAKEKGRNVQLINGDSLPYEDESFDVVYLNEVLIHLFNPETVLKEARRVLKKTGFLLGSTPHRNLEETIFEEKKFHRRYYTKPELETELYKAFDSVYIKTLNGSQFALSLAHSVVADKEAELLFKCGGKDTKDWEEALLDKFVLRVWFGFSHPPADVYYRMRGYADKMRASGAEIAYEDFDYKELDAPGDWQRRIRHKHVQDQFDKILRCADLSVWQITSSPDVIAFLRCIKDLFKKPVITEIDDWLFDIPSYNLASAAYKPNSTPEWCAYEQIRLSDGIIVSTKFLSDSVHELFPDKPVYIVKNSIDFSVWDKAEPMPTIHEKAPDVIRIIYTGCSNHDGDVEIVKKPILALLEEFPNLEVVWPMRFGSWHDVNHPRVFYFNRWINFPDYPNIIKGWNADIGIAPLRDNNLNRAKSCLRWLEYSAAKIPTVASKVGPFVENIVNGQTGYLCNSKKDWYERLKYLILNPSERERLARSAYEDVRSNHNMDQVAAGYMELLKEIKK